MSTFKQAKKIVWVATLLLVGGLSFTSAQTSVNISKNDDFSSLHDNVVALVEPTESLGDSNVVALDAAAGTYRSMDRSSAELAIDAMNDILYSEDFESDLNLEDWMLQPFKESTSDVPAIVDEEEMPLESWMLNLNEWN